MAKFKNIMQKIWDFVTGIWKKMDDLVEKYAPIAIEVVNAIKKVNESTAGDIIEAIVCAVIPGKADDAAVKFLREKLREILPKVLTTLNISQSISAIEDPNEQLKAIVNAINISHDDTKNAYYHALCSLVLQSLADKKLTWSESVQIAEYYYTNIYKQK